MKLNTTAIKLICAMLIICLVLSGCGAGAVAFRVDIPFPVTNLDPQFATSRESKIILAVVLEGLVVQQPSGEIIPGVAESWDVSADGLVYTFHLRRGLYWSNPDQTALTAGDFVFALSRLFDSSAPSPHAGNFTAIRNAERRLEGNRTSPLGVWAIDHNTLQITLERADPMFLTRLASSAAKPVNAELFAAARGRYGLEARFVHSNGPFVLRTWTGSSVHLVRNERYHSPENVPNTATFHIGRGEPSAILAEGRSDFSRVPTSFTSSGSDLMIDYHGYRFWGIVFNTRDPVWRNVLLRQALALSTMREPDEFIPTSILAAESFLVGDRPIFDLHAPSNPLAHNISDSERLFGLGMQSAELPVSPQPLLTILVPDTGGHMPYMGELRLHWQENLPVIIILEAVSPEALERRLRSGEFQAALTPLESESLQLGEMLSRFLSASPENRAGYRNPVFDMFFEHARAAATIEEMAARYAHAHRQLLADAVIIPLYYEPMWYAAAREAYPFAWIYLGGRRQLQLTIDN